MNKISLIAASLVFGCSTINAQRTTEEYHNQIQERKVMLKMTEKALNSKITKEAKKIAKQLAKEGWKSLPGERPLIVQIDDQLRKSVMMSGSLPKYVIGQGNGVSFNTQGAYRLATASAKTDIAGMLSTEVGAVLDESVNELQQDEEYHSMHKLVEESTQYIGNQKLTNLQPIVKMYKDKDDKKVEVRVMIAYDGDAYKVSLFEKMEEENKALRDRAKEIFK